MVIKLLLHEVARAAVGLAATYPIKKGMLCQLRRVAEMDEYGTAEFADVLHFIIYDVRIQ